MQDILELTDIVTKNAVKEIRTLRTCDCRPKEKIDELYDLIQTHRPPDHDTCAQLMGYPGGKDKGYRAIVAKLRERLHNSVVFIDTSEPKFNEVQKAYYSCHRRLVQVKILLGRYARAPAIELLKKTLPHTRKYEFTSITIDLLRLLRNHYAVKTGDRARYEKCKSEIARLTPILEAENLAMEYSEELALLAIGRLNLDQRYLNVAERAINHLSALEVDTYRFLLFRGYITTEYLRLTQQFSALIDTCAELLARLGAKKHAPPQLAAHFLHLQLVGHLSIGNLTKATEMYHSCLRFFEPGTVRWYNTQDSYLRLLFRMKKYHEAYQLVSQLSASKNLSFQPQKRQQTILVFQAYIYYLALSGRLQVGTKSTFRLNKFLNEIPIFSKDKRGYNITVLIIQILILLQQKKYDKFTDRIEAIEKYTSRYLRNDENFRSNCFIKMLLQIPKRNFHRVAVLRHAKPYIKRLATVPLEKSKQSYEIEIIPYEHLWEYALDSLER